ncbi:polysaccharide deacetylase family protein [Leucobacter allii]|uniref:Polysaccharide deacetylase family protein n=1 Tax=Leucobacter allii TaxID=2932247 RepID=A0ABY4FJM2_9MICO|nr:polysaccharide deacetylase family protein [Leucobacter allii]UOQ56758.1 polysaccharide deacetylase family protein [Leucobacter allii]
MTTATAAGTATGTAAEAETAAAWEPPAWPERAFAVSDPVAPRSPEGLPLAPQRIVHAGANVEARFAYLPHEAFNAHIDETIREALGRLAAAGSAPYRPAAGTGLSERGCVEGSTELGADELLATLPGPGVGLVLACDAVLAAGSVLGIRVRVVLGEPGAVAEDRTSTLYADTASGAVLRPSELWRTEAEAEIWGGLVEAARREAGSLSLAEIADPSEAQRDELRDAIGSAEVADDGSLVVRVPEGFSAAELSGLEPSDRVVALPPGASAPLLSEAGASLIAAAASGDYTGPALPAPGERHVDCTLVPCVAVTYDDGPSALTPALLDALAERRAAATFFMLGSAAAAFPDVVSRAAAEGHEIGNHTWNHPALPKLRAAKVREQIDTTSATLTGITGRPVTMFRPPYGEYTGATLRAARLPAILWSVDTNDWKGPPPEELVATAVGTPVPGDIVLMHDIHAGTVEAAPAIIDGLHDRGFTLVTVSQLHGGAAPLGVGVGAGPDATRG